jgi:hypothetical protein
VRYYRLHVVDLYPLVKNIVRDIQDPNSGTQNGVGMRKKAIVEWDKRGEQGFTKWALRLTNTYPRPWAMVFERTNAQVRVNIGGTLTYVGGAPHTGYERRCGNVR